MHDLAQALRGYILDRTNNHPLWAGRTVIFSDAFVPGEGEHKLLYFVRSQRLQIGYNDNTSHCIYGEYISLHLWSRCRFNHVRPQYS